MSTPRPQLPPDDPNEAGSPAHELAHAYRHMAAFYRDQLELPAADAETRARGAEYSDTEAAEDRARIFHRPPDQVSWWDLTRLAERDPEDAAAAWARLKAAARNELVTGHRTALASEWQGRPWDRARFLALRDSFRDGQLPQTGMEAALVDTAAHAFADYLEWSEHLHMLSSSEVKGEEDRLKRDGYWMPPRLSMAEAIEHAATMVERAHTRFLRTLKALHEVRRVAPAVVVGTAGQVNVGGQQVNVGHSSHRANDPSDSVAK